MRTAGIRNPMAVEAMEPCGNADLHDYLHPNAYTESLAGAYRGAAAGGSSNPLPRRVVESRRPSRSIKLQIFAPV